MDYNVLLDKAFRFAFKEVLNLIVKDGFEDGHHLYITFCTNVSGVSLSPEILSNFPDKITIVLEHEFWDLKVFDEYFSVKLSFNGVIEDIEVPYISILRFVDPKVNFGYEFTQVSGLVKNDNNKSLLGDDNIVSLF